MHYSPILLFHICAGTVGLLSGGVAIAFRKGSRPHALAGRVFAVAMMCMAGAGAYMAVMKFQPGNVLGGTFTFYLIATAWMTARRRAPEIGIFDKAAFLIAFTVAAFEVTYGIQAATSPTGMKYGYPPGPYFFLGSVAVFATVGDIRMFLRGGVSGAQRISRHLWRMCFGLFIASGSVFLARAHIFPVFMRRTGMLYFLTFLPLILMLYWLVKIRRFNAKKNVTLPRAGEVYSLQTQASN